MLPSVLNTRFAKVGVKVSETCAKSCMVTPGVQSVHRYADPLRLSRSIDSHKCVDDSPQDEFDVSLKTYRKLCRISGASCL